MELNQLCNQLDFPNFLREDIFYIAKRLKVPGNRNHRFLSGCVLFYILDHYKILDETLKREISDLCSIENPSETLKEIEQNNQFKWQLSRRYREIFFSRQEKKKQKSSKRLHHRRGAAIRF